MQVGGNVIGEKTCSSDTSPLSTVPLLSEPSRYPNERHWNEDGDDIGGTESTSRLIKKHSSRALLFHVNGVACAGNASDEGSPIVRRSSKTSVLPALPHPMTEHGPCKEGIGLTTDLIEEPPG